MKHLPVASKALCLLFAAVFLAACSSSDTKEQEASAEQARIESERSQREAEIAASAEQERLTAAVESYGSVFYFDYDSSTLRADSREALDAHIALMKTTESNVRLDGHTDERGTRDYNMALGERRANAVRDYFVVNGISSYRIESVSYGEERPVAYGSGESNWVQNRRVELK